jgi:L-iditol 2-dehydrogenase
MTQIPKTMRALVYHGRNDLRMEDLPVPRIQSNELLVKVAVCGVCPTDIKKIQHGTVPPPRIFGHETAGTIVRVGNRVRGFRPGDRVGLHHHVPCLDCHFCRHRAYAQCPGYKRTGITAGFEPAGGGFAEYVRVMPFVFPGIVRIPRANSFLEGAMLEPVNTVLKAVNRLGIMEGDRVMVAGQGPIGLLFTRLIAWRGAHVLATDLMDSRLKFSSEFGARWTLRADAGNFRDQARVTGGKNGWDAAVISIPSDAAVEDAIELVRGGGKVLLFGHTRRGERGNLDFTRICVDEKDLIGSYSSDFALQKKTAALVFGCRLNIGRLITHQFSLEQAGKAIEMASSPTENSLKVVVSQELSWGGGDAESEMASAGGRRARNAFQSVQKKIKTIRKKR